ncbi:MAG: DUF969 domain-containing protein, partial [Alkalibacterium sp.]|nr:DUF969 domain-containing protein [Alkalibacterium sp.]
LKLIGILIILIGFIFKVDTIAVVILAGLATALVSGLSLLDFLTLLGDAFVSNRLVTLFFLTLPMIGLTEQFGLRQQATRLIESIKGLTTGRFLSLYMFIRELAGFFSIRIQGHTQFVRPLIEPMAQASTKNKNKHKEEDEEVQEKVKARSAAMENLGNFFAQNTFIAASGVLLIAGTLESLGYDVSAVSIAQASLPVAFIALFIVIISNFLFDKQLSKKTKSNSGKEGEK